MSIAIQILAWVVAAVLGFLLGRFGATSRPRVPDGPSGASDTTDEPALPDADDPTAPITPLVEIARSPHDRHRDLAIGNSLVRSIDALEVVLRSGERQSRDGMLGQVGLLREEFIGLLAGCSFRIFTYGAGTPVDAAMRTRIQIVGGRAGEGQTRIARTVRFGIVYEAGGGEEPVVIRKAEVEIE